MDDNGSRQVGTEQPHEEEFPVRMHSASPSEVLAQVRFGEHVGKKWRQPHVSGARGLDKTTVDRLESQAEGRAIDILYITGVESEKDGLVTDANGSTKGCDAV